MLHLQISWKFGDSRTWSLPSFSGNPSVKLRQATNHSANDHPFPWNNINTNKQKHGQSLLVVGFNLFGKYMPSPRRVETTKYVKPPPKLMFHISYHIDF